MAHDLDSDHLTLLPTHAVDPAARRRPGGPRDVRAAPTPSQEEYEATIAALAAEHIATDSLVAKLQAGDIQPAQVLDQIVGQLARECSALDFDRRQAVAKGQFDRATQISGRRIRSLAALAKLVVRRHELEVAGQAVPPAQLSKVADLWCALIAQAAQVLPADARAALLERHRELMEGWRVEAVGLDG